jgi:hypothetical protein
MAMECESGIIRLRHFMPCIPYFTVHSYPRYIRSVIGVSSLSNQPLTSGLLLLLLLLQLLLPFPPLSSALSSHAHPHAIPMPGDASYVDYSCNGKLQHLGSSVVYYQPFCPVILRLLLRLLGFQSKDAALVKETVSRMSNYSTTKRERTTPRAW